MVQGVDVWLNNPRRPLEASGTSGMKAAANGVVNLSVLDGWWDEGWTGDNGWAIGGRETNPDEGAQDYADAQDLYRLLEQEVVPLYYGRDEDGTPTGWTARDAARRSRARSGGSRRCGCSTSTPSGCTCPRRGRRGQATGEPPQPAEPS
jgi:alpha-glucan phosphorylase-like protein